MFFHSFKIGGRIPVGINRGCTDWRSNSTTVPVPPVVVSWISLSAVCLIVYIYYFMFSFSSVVWRLNSYNWVFVANEIYTLTNFKIWEKSNITMTTTSNDRSYDNSVTQASKSYPQQVIYGFSFSTLVVCTLCTSVRALKLVWSISKDGRTAQNKKPSDPPKNLCPSSKSPVRMGVSRC